MSQVTNRQIVTKSGNYDSYKPRLYVSAFCQYEKLAVLCQHKTHEVFTILNNQNSYTK